MSNSEARGEAPVGVLHDPDIHEQCGDGREVGRGAGRRRKSSSENGNRTDPSLACHTPWRAPAEWQGRARQRRLGGDRLARRERIEATAAEIGATGFVWDTADVDAAGGLIDTVADELGPVDVLVTNTGGPPRGDALGFDREDCEAAYRSLVLAPMALVEFALPEMRARGFGRIVNVASTSVREPIAGPMLSNSHRAAMVTAFKTIALEVAAEGVTLNTLLPGHFATARILDLGPRAEIGKDARATLPIERLGEPEEFAAAAAFLCSARASYITGETLAVDGGKTRSVF